MASITKYRGKWRAQIARNGIRRSRMFDSKMDARAWAAAQEHEIVQIRNGAYPKKTFADAMDRYAREVSILKRGARHERLRLEALARDYPALAGKILSEIRPPDMAAWRDARLKVVSPGSVERDINLISHLFTIARTEWRWMGESPLEGVRRPGDNPPRTRRVSWRETRRLVRWLGYHSTMPISTGYQQVALAFMIGLASAMRAGEILQTRHDAGMVVVLRQHKTMKPGQRPREVPLPRRARKLVARIPAGGWTINAGTLSALFSKARNSIGIEGLHFHDSRAEALTLLARRVDVMILAKISGHRDLKILLNTYYRASAESIAARI